MTDRRTIVHVTDRFAPAIGGTERHIEQLAGAQAHSGHDVHVVAFATPAAPSNEVRDGVSIHRVAGWTRFTRRFAVDPDALLHPTMPDPGFVRAIADVAEAHHADIVHAHNWAGFSAAVATRRSSARFVWSFHDHGAVCAVRTAQRPSGAHCEGPALRACVGCVRDRQGALFAPPVVVGLRSSRHLLDRADALVANSAAVADWMREAVRDPERLRVISPFVPAPNRGPLPRPSWMPATPCVLYVGALAAHKGVPTLLDAYAQLRATTDAPWPLVLVGTAGDAVPEQELAGVTVVRDVDHDEVLAAFSHAGIAVVPSVWPEPFGLVAVEAMSSGAALVASAAGGLREIVTDGVDGVLVPPGDATALHGAIRALVEDPSRRRTLGEGARIRSRDFDADRAFDALYSELSGSAGRGDPPPTG